MTILTIVAITVLVACCIAPPEEKHTAVVSGHPDWKPVMWKEGDKICGIGPEVTRLVFEDIGVKIDSRCVGSWDVVQEKARVGEIDAIVALYKTREREEYLYYSIPYTVDPIVLFFNKGEGFSCSQKESLVGKKGVATIGDSYGQELDDFIVQADLDLSRVSTPEEAFSLLKQGKVDYFIYSAYAGRKVIAELNLSGLEESEVISNQLFYIGVSKRSPYAQHMDDINSSLKRLIENNQIPSS
ncbi:MAG: transporter substrate-binding domain-containing protein [Candidatus Pacebacteria bacterium]|nr:transporter substrate-binding domain-containing protein [Candidatus Paceibacterota bacterium]